MRSDEPKMNIVRCP